MLCKLTLLFYIQPWPCIAVHKTAGWPRLVQTVQIVIMAEYMQTVEYGRAWLIPIQTDTVVIGVRKLACIVTLGLFLSTHFPTFEIATNSQDIL